MPIPLIAAVLGAIEAGGVAAGAAEAATAATTATEAAGVAGMAKNLAGDQFANELKGSAFVGPGVDLPTNADFAAPTYTG